ncbi:hypothetical protein BJ165DRAFT_995260 [Panaeolus papilionaceus]|nr:hypothetical protein BJ165DRAFT_995260 [Panaeolus papilionaceus]
MTFASSSRPILIEFAAASSSHPRANHVNQQSWPLSSPQSASTSQLHTLPPFRTEPIILTYRSPRRTESQSLLETDAESESGILRAPQVKEDDETLSFVHPSELHHFPALDDDSANFSENVGVKARPDSKSKLSRRRIFGWALPSDKSPSSPDKSRKGGSGPSLPFYTRPLRPKVTNSEKRRPKHSDNEEFGEKSADLSRRNTWAPSTPKPFHLSSLPSLILSKCDNHSSSPTIFFRKKKPKFEPEPIEPPERRPPPPPFPPHLQRDTVDILDQESHRQSLIDSLSLDSSLEYDYDDFDPQVLAFGPEILLEFDEDLSSMTGDDSSTEPEEAITPSSSHPYALVGFTSAAVVDEVEADGEWDDVVVLEHTLEEFVLANPISINLQLAPPHRRSSCPSSTSSKRQPRSRRSHHRPSVPLRLPRSVSSLESIKNVSTSQNNLGASEQPNLPQVGSATEERLRKPLIIETLLDDSDADFLDLHESVYSRTISSHSRRESFLSDNRDNFLDLEWSSAGDESSLHIR